MRLKDWLREERLAGHKTSRQEIADLLALSDRDLAACRTPGLVPDWRFSIAYNAASAACNAALAAAGYRTRGTGHHRTVIESLAHTIGADKSTVTRFDRFRKKRNVSGYDRADAISDLEVKEMTALAEELRRDVEKWLRSKHPGLL